jgi:polysaccharide export outer membrane protein
MRDMLKGAVVVLMACSGAVAQAQAPAQAPASAAAVATASAQSNQDYALGPGDVIRVNVYQNQDLTLETRINDDGTISYPLLGSVKLSGQTVIDAEKTIAAGLKNGNFVKQPQVSILLVTAAANQVSVLGMVNKPGRYPVIASNNKLSEIMGMAGGIIPGSGSDIVVVSGTRDGKPFRKEIDFTRVFASVGSEPDFELRNGDTVWVDRAPQVYMYGEVQRPGAQVLVRGTTVLQALANAGGLTLRGTQRGIKVHRRDEVTGQVTVIEPGLNDPLKPNDIIYVKESLF